MAEFLLLGPLEVVVDGRAVQLPAGKPRALLALLLLHRNRVVSTNDLVDELWGDDPPETAASALQVYVSQLRKALGADRLLTKAPGYSIRIEAGELDLDRFEQLLGEGRVVEALDLWRGDALAEFSEPFARDAALRLGEARLHAIELRIEAELEAGRHAELVPELEELVHQAPYRERLRALLMLALYRSGRQADALELYRRTRGAFVDELGIEPSPELQELERAILRHDESLRAGRPPSPPQQEPRRRLGIAGVAVALAALATGLAVVALSHGGSSSPSDSELRTFVSRLENFLGQSREGRQEVTGAISGSFRCKLTPHDAAQRLNRVQRNRQSLLQQVAALSVPDSAQARDASDLFQKAAHDSIAADWHYRDWLEGRKRCGPPDDSPDLRAALEADRKATLAKRAFVGTFNPMARRFGARTWTAEEF